LCFSESLSLRIFRFFFSICTSHRSYQIVMLQSLSSRTTFLIPVSCSWIFSAYVLYAIDTDDSLYLKETSQFFSSSCICIWCRSVFSLASFSFPNF
jgi:hypothetical protein